MNYLKFSDLVGKTLLSIEGAVEDSEEITLRCSDGSVYAMKHLQDCCESVRVADVVGSVDDLLDSPLLVAEESSREATSEEASESGTWTFYKLATVKGWVDLRWLGESNGYYSEDVSLVLERAPREQQA